MHHPTDRIAHTTAFVTPVVEHWLEREIAQWVYPMKDRPDDPSHHERTLLPRSYISLSEFGCQRYTITDLQYFICLNIDLKRKLDSLKITNLDIVLRKTLGHKNGHSSVTPTPYNRK